MRIHTYAHLLYKCVTYMHTSEYLDRGMAYIFRYPVYFYSTDTYLYVIIEFNKSTSSISIKRTNK